MTAPADPGTGPDAGSVKGPDGGPGTVVASARRLVRAGLVDLEWCQIVTGEKFGSRLAAATHILRHHAGTWPTHPLLPIDVLPERVREKLAEGNPVPMLRHLRRTGRARLGPLLDLELMPGTPEEREAHPGGVLGLFLESADASTPLPGHPQLLLGEVRSALIDAAMRLRRQLDLAGPRTTTDWDEAAEAAWRDRWRDAPLPEVPGPLVSIVMPVRNRPQVVEHALASALAQTLEDWELLVIDDGSTDDTLATLERWAAADPRIRVLPREHGGVCVARNHGLAEARGHYVAFLDSDNAWRPDFLRLAVAAMHGQDLHAAYAGMALGDDATPDERRFRAFRGGREHLMVVNHIDLNVLVVERSLLARTGGFDEGLRRWVDHDFALRIAAQVDLELLPFIAVDYDDTRGDERPADRITTLESDSWQFVVLGQHWVDWPAVRAAVGDRVDQRISVVIPTWNDARMTVNAVGSLLRNTPDTDLEVVILDNGSRPEVSMVLAATEIAHEAVRVVRLPRNLNFAIGCNVGFAHSTGEHVLFLNNDTVVLPGWKEPLIAALTGPDVLGVQPLLMYADNSVQAAGTAFPLAGFLPTHFLVGHPPEDAARMSDRRFHVVTAAAVALRADLIAELGGFDPVFVNGMEDIDLCLRAAEARGGHFLVVPESRVIHFEGKTPGRADNIGPNRIAFDKRWRGRLPAAEPWRWNDLGFEIAHVSGDAASVPAPQLVLTRPAPAGAPHSLRWGLRSPAPGGEAGEQWGDTHFLASLGAGLEALGQEVVSYRRGAHHDPASAYDDVVLGVRGLTVIHPVPGKVNVLWIISHPDDVHLDELVAFDLVYASSESWAAELAQRAGREVRPLLQATDARRANLSGPVGRGDRPVFVGGATGGRVRPIVDDALAQDVPLVVHGPQWAGKVPEHAKGRDYIPNSELLQTYRDSGLVLADHWGDMARNGFLANRLFDAVAAGARVVSDPVDGLEIFEGAVLAYHSVEELAELCSPAGRERFPDDETMAQITARIFEEHSFEARAATLLHDVQEILRLRVDGVTEPRSS